MGIASLEKSLNTTVGSLIVMILIGNKNPGRTNTARTTENTPGGCTLVNLENEYSKK